MGVGFDGFTAMFFDDGAACGACCEFPVDVVDDVEGS